MLNWDLSNMTVSDFSGYRLYRRVVGVEDWDIIADIAEQSIGMYEDNTAGQTVQYEYKITQFKSVVGDVPLESDPSDSVFIALTTDAWFIVMLVTANFHALELNVTEEEHSAVVQQEVFEPLASSRKRVIRGNVLGDEGSITAMFDQSMSSMAREHMEHIKMNKGPHILKSPFGDVWYVEFDSPGYKYVSGGHLQISIGWVEII
jgi:hypothetical protein